jgi:hypothetical protein
MLHGVRPDQAVSTRGPIALRYRSPLWFSKKHDFSKSKKNCKAGPWVMKMKNQVLNYPSSFFCMKCNILTGKSISQILLL